MPSNSLPAAQTVKANAKINLALRITGKRADGYHNLSTIFQEIDFCDYLTFTPASEYALTTSLPDLPTDERNLCTRAYRLLQKAFNPKTEFAIHLIKHIPQGAGLGGGSADAAAVLKFLNQAWELHLNPQQLQRIGRQLGADVPFFIRGGTQGASGIGDQLIPLRLPHPLIILLVIPPLAVSTDWAYQQFQPTDYRPDFRFAELIQKDLIRWEQFENQFEQVVFPAYPEIAALKTTLLATQALYAGLSGSGSTVFGIFRDLPTAQSAAAAFPNHQTVITSALGIHQSRRSR